MHPDRRHGSPMVVTALVLTMWAASAAEPQSPSPNTVRVAGIVLKWLRGDKEANYRRVEPLIREAAAHGAQIVVTTECFLDGYSAEDRTVSQQHYRALG